MTLVVTPPAKAFPTHNSLRAAAREQMSETLNRRLADALDLQGQCKQAHWNVKGPDFMSLHLMFDQVNTSVMEYADLIAERIVQLGGTAEGTCRTVSERSELDEYPLAISSGADHLKALTTALAAFGSRIRFAIQEADELEDADTADVCTEISRGADKWLWMVEAHLQSRP